MSDPIEEVKDVVDDVKPEDLSKVRVPDMLSTSEKEVFVARIKELEAKISELEEKLAKALEPKREPKSKGVLDRFSPL